MRYLKRLATMPHRAWHWGQRYPYESIFYGLVLIAAAMVSKLAIVIIAAVSICSGMVAILGRSHP